MGFVDSLLWENEAKFTGSKVIKKDHKLGLPNVCISKLMDLK